MGILNKAKELTDKISNSVTEFSSDEIIAKAVMKAVEKQEKVNAILKQKGSNYRVSDIELQMGIPPTITFGVRRNSDKDESKLENSDAEDGITNT